MRKHRFIGFLLAFMPFLMIAQRFELPSGQKYEKVPFELINNLVVIPVNVNGSELTFILDSGLSTPILFNLSDQDSIQINKVSEISLRGLGGGEPIKALNSSDNAFKIGKIENPDQRLFVVLDKSINFSTSLGIPIHGIIGYDLFRDFVVEMNYKSRYIKLHNPKQYQYKKNKKSQTMPLFISNKKAYVEAEVQLNEIDNAPVRMLLDTGSSDAIWLLENQNIALPDAYYDDFLGRGLGGDIFGKRTRVSGIKIGNFMLNEAKTAFPDTKSFSEIKHLGNRNGSIGGEILKRFNIIFDYHNKQITLRKNGNYSTPFQYNLSGIDLQHDGVRYVAERIADANGLVVKPDEKSFGNVQILLENRTRLSLVPEIIVSGIRAGSPAEEAGLKEGDVILAVNGKRIHQYKIQEILQLLNEKEGKKVRVLIERYNADLKFSFVLKDLFDKKKPPR